MVLFCQPRSKRLVKRLNTTIKYYIFLITPDELYGRNLLNLEEMYERKYICQAVVQGLLSFQCARIIFH